MATDILFVDRLSLSAKIGLDCWGRSRPQTVLISIYLHLAPDGFLARAGQSDNVNDTVDYGRLTKAVMMYVEGKENGFSNVEQMMNGVVEETFHLAGENGREVCVTAELPKMVQLAQGGMAIEIKTTQIKGEIIMVQKKVYVKDISLAVIIGVNEPERHGKQRVVVNLEIYERVDATLDYPAVVQTLAKDMDRMEYLTLEKMVWEIAHRTCCLLGEQAEKVTIRAQKPSALSFAQSSGIQITRRMADF
ncbi:hypothetical protein APHAL10511_006762 [Amanita phalloides]|nr:hypothetical protein APHAL10511_006762 [Amanita phalloides]